MLSGANLQPNFWPYAFNHYLWVHNFVPHGNRPSSPNEMCGAPLPNLTRLRTFGCRIHVRPTTARYGRVVPNSRLGVFLGYSRSLVKVMYYYDLGSWVRRRNERFGRTTSERQDRTEPYQRRSRPPRSVVASPHQFGSLQRSVRTPRRIIAPRHMRTPLSRIRNQFCT
jgi:hypothetical protein